MTGPSYAKLGLTYRPKSKKTFSTVTTVAFACVAITVMVLFWMGHSSVMRMHTAMHSPSMEQPAGWATLHKTTTVQSATVTISGSEITGSALTATTTETQAAGTAADSISSQQAASQATAVATAAAANSSSRLTSSLAHMLGDLQHSLHAMLTAHAGWKPGDKITRAQLAAAAAASVPDDGRDIELHAHKVAEVVGGAKVAQQLQRLAQGGVAALLDDGQDELTSAEAFAGLYGAGGSGVTFTAAGDLATCPEGSPTPGAAQVAVVLLAGTSTAALRRSLDGLMLLYSRASSDVRSAFHLYVALNSSSSEEIKTVATNYVHDTMGAVKLVQDGSSRRSDSSRSSSGSQSEGNDVSDSHQQHAASVGAIKAATVRRLLSTSTAGIDSSSAHQQKGEPDKQQRESVTQQSEPLLQINRQHSSAAMRSSSRSSASSSTGSTTVVGDSQQPGYLQLLLHVFLQCFQYPAMLLLDDDVKLAPDFLDFFYSTSWLLGSDPTLYCLSAWNPQGHRQQVVHAARIIRTDYNPGKAWLLRRELGLQLLARWQQQHKPSASSGVLSHAKLVELVSSADVRGGRQCLAPELPRVVPAGVDETSEGAHIHDPHSAGRTVVGGSQHTFLRAADYTVRDANVRSSPTGSGSSSWEEGAVDVEAYMTYERDDSDDLIADNEATHAQLPILHMQHELSPDAGDAEGHRQQHHWDQHNHADNGAHHNAAWLEKDLSLLLAADYEAYMHQALLKAALCDVAAAAALADTHAACVVTYSSAAELSATSHQLGVPVAVKQGVKYCYEIPAPAAAQNRSQHCQDYMPEMAYEGIVSGYNNYSVRVFLAPRRCMEALKQLARSSAAAAAAGSVANQSKQGT